MLKRNSTVKLAPQRWQENAADGSFDIVFTFEEKVFDMVIEGWYRFFFFIFTFILVFWLYNNAHNRMFEQVVCLC